MIVSRAPQLADAAAQPAAGRGDGLPMPGTPWSLRLARGPGGRPALEVYEAGELLDIVVPTPLAPGVLRGARRSMCGSGPRSLAWGRLPEDGAAVTATFSRGRLRRASAVVRVTEIGTWFWVATVAGYFDRVAVSYGHASPGGRP